MNIRDIGQYIANLCGSETLNLLGTNKELLLQKIYGQDPSPNQVKSVISDAASFASNAEEQLFYEFVQNAYDANADSLFFYANENYLIVLNNGEPFYTDFDIFDSEQLRDGQLYNFLAKGKSLKRNDESKLGKYGQGSKLLYTLLADSSADADDDGEELIIDALYNKKKGPILISWYNRNQLANLLQEDGNWVLSQADDYKNNILLAKILMSYYPITPSVSENLFSNDEALSAIKAFDTLVNPRRNLHFLDKGTALIIPLGKGKYDKITSYDNLSRVKTRLGGFASIIKDQERNEGKTVNHIYVMGEEIEQHEVKSVVVEYKNDKKTTCFHFAFNPVFAETNFVNFFKGLPILDTKLRLGFILDTQRFDVTDDRQRFKKKDDTKPLLVRAFTLLVEELEKLKHSDKTKFSYIYQALLASRVPDGDEYSYARTAFHEVFKPFFSRNVFSTEGTYEKKEHVRYYEHADLFPLEKIGITKYKWIDPLSKRGLTCNQIHIESVDYEMILRDADAPKFEEWIKSLSLSEYYEIFKISDSLKANQFIANYKLFRSNLGNSYSYTELNSTAPVFYPFEQNMNFGESEHIDGILSDIDLTSYLLNLFNKIRTNIEIFRANDSTVEDAANLLNWIGAKDNRYISRIKSEIKLLSNRHGEFVTFEELLLNRPEGTIFFDNFLSKGYVPRVIIENHWLLNPTVDSASMWRWIVSKWEYLKTQEEWGENTLQYISDVKKVYNSIPNEIKSDHGLGKLTLWLTEEGMPSNLIRAIVNNAARLSKEEYEYLGEKVCHLRLLPYQYFKELINGPFEIKTIQSDNIINDGLIADKKLLRIIIKISDGYLNHYRTQEFAGKYKITKSKGGFNYIDDVSEEIKKDLESVNIHRIPSHVQEILKTESPEYRFSSNPTMLKMAIERISNPIVLLPLVKNSYFPDVIESFFKHINNINIDSKISNDDLRWQVIDLAIQRTNDDHNYIELVHGLIKHKGYGLPVSITQRYVEIGNRQYDTYLLDSAYQSDNEAIDSFFMCLPSTKEADYFKENFYKNKEEKVSTENLFDELKNQYLSIDQLKFCLDYALTNNEDCKNLEISGETSVSSTMDMILENKFIGFDKHFKIAGVNFETQIFANHEFLLTKEFLPDELQSWLENNELAVSLFTNLKTSANPFIHARECILNDKEIPDISCFGQLDKLTEIDNTIEWLIEKKLPYVYETTRFRWMMSIIEKLPSEYTIMPFLRYTDEYTYADNQPNKIAYPIFRLERFQSCASFLSYYSWAGTQFQSRIGSCKSLRNFLRDRIVYIYGSTDILTDHGLNKCPRWAVQTSVDTQVYPEVKNAVYNQWKQTKESKGITIHTSEKPISMNFNIMSANKSIFADKLHDSEFGYEIGRRVVIQMPNKENLSLMKAIAKHIINIDFFKDPFIALQALYVEKLEKLQDEINIDNSIVESQQSTIDLSKTQLSEKEIQKAVDTISSDTIEKLEQVNKLTETMSEEELDKLNDAVEPIKELIDDLDKDDLERIAANKDKLVQIIDDLEEAEEEEKESKVRQTIGFIGELIYRNYLENQHKSYVHAALDGVGGYDFEILEENMYVDVKTTLYSLKDGTAPFYLHTSQNRFMQKHPDSKYHIVRISLNDLNLKKSYEEVRDTYGKDANPLENTHLRKRCESIAKKYWKAATIEEFDALSPEYAIKIKNIRK